MLCNLKAEMARKGIKTSDIASLIGVNENTARNKLAGRTKFNLDEALKINFSLFPGHDICDLFATDQPDQAS